MTAHLALKITMAATGTDIFDDISIYLAQIEGKWLQEKTFLLCHKQEEINLMEELDFINDTGNTGRRSTQLKDFPVFVFGGTNSLSKRESNIDDEM